MSSRRIQDRLADIITNIDSIEQYIGTSDIQAYSGDQMTRDASERCLERIIEAVVKIGVDQMALIDPAFPVERARGLGNMLRHAYDKIDEELIFNLLKAELPRLRTACVAASIQG